MKNILITLSNCGVDDRSPLEAIENAGFRPVTNPYCRKLNQDEVGELIREYQPVGMIAGVEPLNKEILEHAQSLKVISRCGVGLDNIDLETARKREIKVLSTPAAPCQAVAELTVAMMLASLRKIVTVNKSIQEGRWERPMGQLLHEKKVGVIGCGRIGSRVAELLSGFGVNLCGYDPEIKSHTLIEMVSFQNLLETADLVTLHLPYHEGTHHLIGRPELGTMKTGAILVNTSRGGLVDEEALYDSLKSGHLGGACLDTFEKEPYTGKLISRPNAILTPHIGSYAREARIKMEIEAAENLLAVLGGGVLSK